MCRLHVVAGVVRNAAGEILLSLRQRHRDQGGLWEFPGGKVEANESPEQALQRELVEEVGIQVTALRPLIRVHHNYPTKQILLDVWNVDNWHGEAWGREGQMLQWCAPAALNKLAFPAANTPIIHAARLPDRYAITPEPEHANDMAFFTDLRATLEHGIGLLQVRAKKLSDTDFRLFATQVLEICANYPVQVLLNAAPELAQQLSTQGVHLDSHRLQTITKRPVPKSMWLCASCHTLADLQHAQNIDCDFVVLSPVKTTKSHPNATPLGWQAFFQLTEQSRCPVYALGGMQVQDINWALAHGGQGVAAIRGVWVKGV